MRRALIVGAGIGGLAAAVALRRAGWEVRVFERASSPRELGLADAIRRGGFIATSGEMRRPDGTVLRRFDTASLRPLLEEDTVCILRPVLHGALLEAVGLSSIELEAPAIRFDLRPDGVQVRLADGRTDDGQLLVGADGVASVI